ncbi:zinc finger and BTB domain-containing protein 24-like [Ostrinia nubilalis]|uniref:zinc finger and BTB domain-containing protein 24-like n=1 Tax=Ostrinia nubilalis TaxID=29057 RepID=UPI003082303A
MSSFLCFICHSTVNDDTNEDVREKYREVVGMNLCPDSHMCHICCHVLNRLWLFRSVCLKRSLEYPVLFSEKGTLNLQRNDLEIHTVCFEDCEHYKNRNINSKYYHFKYFDDTSDSNEEYPPYPNDYVKLEEDRREFEEFLDKPNYEQALPNNKTPEFSQNFTDEFTEDETNNDYEESHSFEDDNANDEQSHNIKEEQKENCERDEYVQPTIKLEEISDEETEIKETKTKKHEKKKGKSKKEKEPYVKFKLSVSEQKTELERSRKEKKYIEAEFKCYNCALGFLFKDTYQAHMMRHEESNGEHRCNICTLRFASPAVLRAHTSLHAERHKCTNCGVVVRPRHRASHTRECLQLPTEGVACHLCGKVFNGPNALQQHLKRFHRSKSSGRTYACTVCGERYNDQAAVRTHMM